MSGGRQARWLGAAVLLLCAAVPAHARAPQSVAVLQMAMRRHHAALEQCLRAGGEPLPLKLVVEIQFDPSGRVETVALPQGVLHSELTEVCVSDELRRVRVQLPRAVRAVMPLVFVAAQPL